ERRRDGVLCRPDVDAWPIAERPERRLAGEEVPGVEQDDRHAELERQGDLGERPRAAAERDQRVRGVGVDVVAAVAEAGKEGTVDERVRLALARRVRQDADRAAAALARAASRRLHDAAKPAAEQQGAAGGEAPADLARQ